MIKYFFVVKIQNESLQNYQYAVDIIDLVMSLVHLLLLYSTVAGLKYLIRIVPNLQKNLKIRLILLWILRSNLRIAPLNINSCVCVLFEYI